MEKWHIKEYIFLMANRQKTVISKDMKKKAIFCSCVVFSRWSASESHSCSILVRPQKIMYCLFLICLMCSYCSVASRNSWAPAPPPSPPLHKKTAIQSYRIDKGKH